MIPKMDIINARARTFLSVMRISYIYRINMRRARPSIHTWKHLINTWDRPMNYPRSRLGWGEFDTSGWWGSVYKENQKVRTI